MRVVLLFGGAEGNRFTFCVPKETQNRCVARSSPRQRHSSAPHLDRSIPHILLYQKEEPPLRVVPLFGGAEGNRTPVRKQLDKTFSGRSLLFTFPLPHGNKHPYGISSFMMRGMGKAYQTHVLYSDHTLARLVDLPGRMGA